MDQKCSAAMMAAKRSAGVAPEVNLRNLLHVGERIHNGFKTHGRLQKSKIGASVAPQKELVSKKKLSMIDGHVSHFKFH